MAATAKALEDFIETVLRRPELRMIFVSSCIRRGNEAASAEAWMWFTWWLYMRRSSTFHAVSLMHVRSHARIATTDSKRERA